VQSSEYDDGKCIFSETIDRYTRLKNPEGSMFIGQNLNGVNFLCLKDLLICFSKICLGIKCNTSPSSCVRLSLLRSQLMLYVHTFCRIHFSQVLFSSRYCFSTNIVLAEIKVTRNIKMLRGYADVEVG
jgi:hypothetical protein